jgi:purine-binding chemotaxis protein CheW
MLKVTIANVQASARPTASAQNAAAASQSDSFLMFSVSGHSYAVRLLDIREVRKAAEMTRVAHAPKYVRGVTSIRGEIIPVINLKERFGLPRNQADDIQSLILVSEMEGRRIAIEVDAVSEVIAVDPAAVQAIPKTTMVIDIKYLLGMVQHLDTVVLLLDLAKILKPSELHEMSATLSEPIPA